MTSVFLFGTLLHAPLFGVVAGTKLHGHRARLAGKRVARVAGAAWPMLTDDAVGAADGLLIEVEPDALERLDFYEACHGYIRHRIEVQTKAGAAIAEAWRPAGPADGQPAAENWSLSDWARDWGEIAVLSAAEVMRHHGRSDPASVARLFPIIRARADSIRRTRHWRRPASVGGGPVDMQAQILNRSYPYEAFFTVEEVAVRQPRFDGGTPQEVNRAVFHVCDAVTVLPYDPVRDCILLVEQMRFGLLVHGDPVPWSLEPIAGMIDAGDTVEATARREAEEEANLALKELHFVARYYPSPGGVAQVLFSYVATADLPDEAAGRGGHVGEGEDIQSHVVPYAQAVEMLERGEMANAPLILTMQWLIVNRDRLRSDAGAA